MTRVMISVPDKFLDKMDEVAEREERSRSELIREAVRYYVAKKSVTNPIKGAKIEVVEAEL